jgi:predicted lipid carrier protein YhbT
MMHRADAELAAGRAVVLDPALAADGIDEWLSSVADPRYRRQAPGAAELAAGAVMHLHAADAPGGPRDWLVSAGADGITVRDGQGRADVTVAGPAARLLLVLVRRMPPDEENVSVTGEPALLAGWLAGTPF